MVADTRIRFMGLSILLALSVSLATVSGCTKAQNVPSESSGATSTRAGKLPHTALENLPAAASAATSRSADAKLLTVQMNGSRTPDGRPKWFYVFTSQSKDAEYPVLVQYGRVLNSAQSTATLGPDELAQVPGSGAWKVDSDEAFRVAMAATGGSFPVTRYIMGMETYKSRSDTSTVEPFVWRVHLLSEATTAIVDVNATTGAAIVVNRP